MQKKARFRQTRPLLIVPFKTKTSNDFYNILFMATIFTFAFFIVGTSYARDLNKSPYILFADFVRELPVSAPSRTIMELEPS